MTANRLHNLDVIRGVAILGILFMNIHLFALPQAAYINPDWHGRATLTDQLVFSFQHLFVDGRFMTLFCLLFGAGIVLMQEKLNRNGLAPKKTLQRRLGWLLLFGWIHGTFIWFGDILFVYALAGLLLVKVGFLSLPPRQLIARGLGFFASGQLLLLLVWLIYPILPDDVAAEFGSGFTLSAEQISEDAALWTGPWLPQVIEQLQRHLLEGTVSVLLSYFWSICGLMMIGAALYKLGIFQRGLSPAWQWGCLAAGLSLSGLNLGEMWQDNFANPRAMYSVWNYVAALPMALFYVAVLVKLSNAFGNRLIILRHAGRMAFTLYILQSVVMVLVFRWWWPELYGELDRLTLFGIALLFSAIQTVVANAWLQRFGQGPLERLWRHLTYQPIRKVTGFCRLLADKLYTTKSGK